MLSGAIHRPQDVKQLSPHRGIGLERNPLKLSAHALDRPTSCHVHEVVLELVVLDRMDPHRSVPFAVDASPVADAVPGELYRLAADVLHALALFVEESVQAPRRDDDEEAMMSQVLDIGQALLLATGSRPLTDGNVVLLHQLLVDPKHVLVLGNTPGDVVPISMAHVTDGKLLNERSFG